MALVEAVGSDVSEKMSAVDPIFEKECTIIMEMDGSSSAKTGDKKDRELRGPFEISADSISVSGDERGGKDEKNIIGA
jgi:hypothetical protein